jgi:RimJ/RimL family protein N-acetyltransferase
MTDVVIRDLTLSDRELIGEFFGPARVNEGFTSSGMHIDAEHFDIDQLVELARLQPDDLKVWLAVTPDGRPVCLQLFHRLGFPGVWTYSVVTAARVDERHGVGTRMIVKGLDRLFSDPSVRRLMGYISMAAPAPRRIAEKLGFVVEGTARSHIELPDGSRVDALIVAMLAEEWAQRRADRVSDLA